MKEIRIGPGVQRVMALGLVAVVGAAMAAQAPEIKRYLKIKRM